MRKKLFGKLLSVALSATMAVTSAVPAYAADGLALTDTDQKEELIEEETLADDVTKGSDTDENEVKEKGKELIYDDVDEDKPEDDQENAAAKESKTSLLGAKSASNDPEEEIGLEEAMNYLAFVYRVDEGGDTNTIDGTTVSVVTNEGNVVVSDQTLGDVPAAKMGYHLKSANRRWYLDENGNSEMIPGTTVVKAGGSLYALYDINKYTIEYNSKFFNSEEQAVTGETPEVTFAAKTYPTSVDYSSSWYGSLADGPVVENYSFEGWYTDEGCTTENKAGQDTMNNTVYDEKGMSITLYAKYVQNSEDTGDLKIVDGGNVSYAYGATSSDTVTYTAQAYEKVWKDYENATWSVYEIVDSTITSSDEARYASSNLSKVTSDELAEEYGISFAKSTSNAAQLVFKTTGPKKALDGNYLLKITNSDGSKEAVLEENFNISDAAITGLSDITFKSAEMGYSVKSANYAGAETNITKAVEEVISIGGILDEKYAINDLTYEWDGNDPEAFEIESDGKGVYTGQSETITIKPKEGLDNYYDNVDHNGVYTADLYAKSKAFSKRKKLLTVFFTVTSNLKLASATAHGGSEAEKGSAREAITTNGLGLSEADYGYFYANAVNNTAATNGAETVYADVYDLGTVNVGTEFDDTLVTATGGVDKISINYVGNSPFTNGITGLGSANAGVATYLISGTPTAIGEKLILLQASDIHNNKSKVVAYKLKIEGADVSYTMTGENIEAGKASASDNIIEWYAVSGYTASAESKNLVISNNSEKDIEISVAYKTYNVENDEFVVDNNGGEKFPITGQTAGKVTVPKRGSSTLTITPQSGLAKGESIDTILMFTAAGMGSTAINLSFKVNVNDLEITKPAGTYTWETPTDETTPRYVKGTSYDLDLEIGKPFTFQIGTTASENVESIKWAITKFINETSPSNIKAELKEYGLSINENTGILVGTPKKALTGGELIVTATPTLTGVDYGPVPVPCAFSVTIEGSADEFSLTANGNTIDSSENILDLGTISIDKIDTVSQTFNVMNVSSLDIEDVEVSLDNIKRGNTSSSATTGGNNDYDDYFELVFDENNSNLNDQLESGFELAANESRNVLLKASDDFEKVYTNVGTYWIPVKVVDQADPTNGVAGFVAKIKVTDAPIINASAITGIVANSEIKESSSTIKYTLKLDNTDETKNYTYQWTSGSVPGLTLSESGVVYGTATEAGEFEVTVTATNKKDSSITGVLTHKIAVNGNASLELKASNLSDFVDKFILLPGIVVGDEVNKTVQTFNISSSNDTAKNVKITIEDAPDDRDDTSEIKESPENPYIGSTNYIGVNKTGFTEITTQGTENFSIVTKSSVAPGVYKVKITVSADNANKQVFYVIMAVVEKFAITTPTDITTKIGKAYTIEANDGTSYIEDGDLEIVATGGAGRQTITWSEAGTKDSSGSTKYYVTKNGTAGTASDVTGFTLVGSRGRIDGKATTNASTTLVDPAATTGSKAYLTATAVKASGNYSVTLKAKVNAADYISGNNVDYRDDMSKAIYLNEDNLVKASSTKAFPAQEATSVTFTISSGKAEDVKVTGVTGATGAGTIEGFKNGNVYVTTTGFTYDPVNPSYTNTSLGISVNVSNYMVGISTKVKAAFSENSNFEVVNASETTIQKAENANTPGVGAFQIRPKAKLAKGTYTDTLTISGNEFESITFDVSFTVEDASYVADVIGTVDDEDVKYVENSVVTGNILSLDNYVVDATKVSETLTVANVGNSALSRVSAYEVKADGTKYATGSADTMLTVGVISTTIAAGAQNTFTIMASKNTAGVYTTYVNLHYTKGTADTAVERDVWFPVTYTVYAKDIDTINVSPETKTTITVAENYEPASAATEFVVTNTGSDVTSTLVGYTVTSTNSNFEVLPSTAKELAAGSSATFKLQPKQGKMLSAGEYTTKLRVSGGNIKTAVERDVTLVVTESEEYTIKAYTAGYDIEDTSIAEKFWNTFAYGKNVSLTSENSNAKKIMNVDVDEDRTPDIALTFTFDDNVTNKNSAKSIPINKVNVKLLSTNISTATQSLTLKTTEQTAAKSGHGDTYSDAGDAHDAKFFTTVNINFYGTVVFGTTNNTEYAELKTNLENDNVVVQTTVGGTGANKNNAKGTITAYVPFASKLGSVFASGKLPTAVSAGSIMNAWKKNGTSIIVSADRVIYSDYALDPDYHTHSYAEANNKDEKYVKWVWSTDEKGNLSTVLHLYCTDPDCPDYAGSEIVITDSALTTDTSEIAIWKSGDSLVTYDARAGKDADCEHGSRYEYPAQAKVDGITYKNSYIEAEEGKPLGHQFNLKVDAEIVWTDKNSDGIIVSTHIA